MDNASTPLRMGEMTSSPLLLDEKNRRELWSRLIDTIESYLSDVESVHVTPELNPEKIRSLLRSFDFTVPEDPSSALDFISKGLWEHQVHTPHPKYFGLFNPAPTTMGIAADTLVALFNPQLAAWSHSPLAIEIEHHLVRSFAARFGYNPDKTDGTFTSGGAEANHTALLTALTSKFPEFIDRGIRALKRPPVFYLSSEGHHSFVKAARLCGLGTEAVREIPVDKNLQLDTDALIAQIERDRKEGSEPFMVVATAGTTSAGVIDPLHQVGEIAEREGMWFHVDAAWGGAAVFVPELRSTVDGIEKADSITFDAHKWLSVPMGAGLYFTRHPDILDKTFRIATSYMPREAAGLDVVDPYSHSMQWSRRFIGLKVFLSLAVAGWKGYAAAIRRQTKIGDLLRIELKKHSWRIVNETKLPVICFIDGKGRLGAQRRHLEAIANAIVSSGRAWISTTQLGKSTPSLRACITNYRTRPADIHSFIEDLEWARSSAVP